MYIELTRLGCANRGKKVGKKSLEKRREALGPLNKKNNFSLAGNRTRGSAVKTRDVNHYTTRDCVLLLLGVKLTRENYDLPRRESNPGQRGENARC